MRGRPLLYTSYESDQAIFNTMAKKVFAGLGLLVLVLLPFNVVPGLGFLAAGDWLRLLSTVAIFVIGGLGLNILLGLAGQVSLGHAFFMGVGAYVAAVLGGDPEGVRLGFGLPLWIWLPAAGIVAALIGIAFGPAAVRVRGLYLAFVTLGLVFVGDYVFRNWISVTGGAEVGRTFPPLQFRLWKEEEPLIDFTSDGAWLGIELISEAKTFYFVLAAALLFMLLAKNLQRTRIGRAFQSIRDRDIAAEIMGVDEFRNKLRAFGISSFYAGVSGALLASFVGTVIPSRWDLFLSIQFIAIVLIGGAGTVAGVVLGTSFVILLPRVVQDATLWMQDVVKEGDSLLATLLDLVVATDSTDFGLVNTLPGIGPGLSVFQLNQVIYGLLIIGFLIFEPLGLYGIWIKIRNYWKGWPFTY
ncbi:MAG: branched-chain amino acid ABC transporter permease [Acidobacteria bacterium]|nr:branched-chain amino acid ABC transporter permease [Acidobacteriota bacterium]MCZ6662208.1 branched-chain amino acid ABC transporter permease [Actinomycetota bacterium]